MPDLERFRWLVVALFAAPLLIGIGFLLQDRLDGPDPLEIEMDASAAGDIRVYIAGAVQRPGVYPVAEGSRWIDALEAAGGATAEADLTAVNLARRVRDEDRIVVPHRAKSSTPGATTGVRLTDLNTATTAELDALPGIGEVRAAAILKSRSEEGAFTAPEDLLKRKLLPSSVYEEILPLITVGQ